MKKLLYLFAALMLAAGCDYISDSNNTVVINGDPGSGGDGGDGGNGNGWNGNLPAGSEDVGGVFQPRGAIKHILDVQSDNREWHLMDYDDTYIYDAQGRVVTDKCTQSVYEGYSGKFLFKDDYEYTRIYDGTSYAWCNTPNPASKAEDGQLNAKGQLVSLKHLGSGGVPFRTDTFTYDEAGHLVKFVKDNSNSGETTAITYTWDRSGNLASSEMTVSKNGSVTDSETCNYQYSRDLNPTYGYTFDLMHRACFPITNQIMMLGLGPRNLLTEVYIVQKSKANLGLISRFFSYEWNSEGTQITKMIRTTLAMPCEKEQILLKERTIDTFTIDYYK